MVPSEVPINAEHSPRHYERVQMLKYKYNVI